MTGRWTLCEDGIPADDRLSNTYLSGNGHLGLRATLDEHGADHRAGLLVNGLYDQVPGRWREPVNAPHPLNFRVGVAGSVLDVATSRRHTQGLDYRYGVQTRSTTWTQGEASLTLEARRWVSRVHPHLVQADWTLVCDAEVTLEVTSGIDGQVWDLNGPHLEAFVPHVRPNTLGLGCRTQEAHHPLEVWETVDGDLGPGEVDQGDRWVGHRWNFTTLPGSVYRWRKIAVVDSLATLQAVGARGFDALEDDHRRHWDEAWNRADVVIEGDEEAQTALRYSLYQLMSTAPGLPGGRPGLSIPARGVSGQVYKGAVFWDTEVFMLPFFLNAFPDQARALVDYRIHGLPGARAKATEEGHQGAFYAWECQDGGREACTLFNVNDVLTGRPLRTFFRDKQIHISADVALAVASYVRATGDRSILGGRRGGGLEVVLECARFLLSWAVWRPDRGRYEFLDVTGPDEYHERVDNDYWTNFTAHKALEAALELVRAEDPDHPLVGRLAEVVPLIYVPKADAFGVVPQCDGYRRWEDATPAVLRTRLKHPHEYWGCGDGVARWTQVIKQADVVLAQALYPEDHPREVREASWDYYEPRTEHGSSLSACAYAIAAARLGRVEVAHRYFLKTATVDLTGDSKQFVGDLYIGGTHPAANGGAWMTVVQGFLGLSVGTTVTLDPHLPLAWTRVALSVGTPQGTFDLEVVPGGGTLVPQANFRGPLTLRWGHRRFEWPGTRALSLVDGWPPGAQAALFDLDGVLVDTARYHYRAWRKLANSLGFDFSDRDNESLKGVSRTESLEIILALGGVTKTPEEKAALADQKNRWYVEMIGGMDPSELLPGVVDYLTLLRSRGIRVALGSASKNASTILAKTGIAGFFDAVVDGNRVTRSKPDPEVFVTGARDLGVDPRRCVVFEDSRSGVAAARAAGMAVVGIGTAHDLGDADWVVAGVGDLL